MIDPKAPFNWRHFQSDIILLNVRWYDRYALSYRDLEEMMLERGVEVDHTTIYRWVQDYAPEIDKRIRPYLNPTNDCGEWTKRTSKLKRRGSTFTGLQAECETRWQSGSTLFSQSLGSTTHSSSTGGYRG